MTKDIPYRDLPDHSFWQRGVCDAGADVDPVVAVPFTIGVGDRVATAGSCFAQHISRHLRKVGFDTLCTEPPHGLLRPQEAVAFNYGLYTARYGNVNTARQLLQLFQRAVGSFVPEERLWADGGRFIDPFRPRIQPRGFACREEFEADQAQHFAAVREAFETLDVLVFTLGLTEAWESTGDGAVFPICPGVAGGRFDAQRHRMHNFDVGEVTDDMLRFIDLLREVNPAARLILTVSPVPLVATAFATEHVLAATTYSKSVLRVACAEIARRRPQVAYMPSFEIITGQYARGRYFAPDLRSVTEEGVGHVMRVFFRHFVDAAVLGDAPQAPPPPTPAVAHLQQMGQLADANCDDDILRHALATTPALHQVCNLCDGEAFGPGPHGRLSSTGLKPHCERCGSLERHRVASRALQALPRNFLDWRRALLVNPQRKDDPMPFRHCDIAQATAPGALLRDLAAREDGLYDFIVLLHVLEHQDDDRAVFEQLVRLLSPRGVMQVCFVDPHLRPWTSIATGPAGSLRRWYGRDVSSHFRCPTLQVHVKVDDVTDPGTGVVMPVHFFYGHPEHQAALETPSAPTQEISR
jgi:SAM-dependent methyltransferase